MKNIIILLAFISLIAVSCKKNIVEGPKIPFVVSLTADTLINEQIPVIFSNGIDYFNVDTVKLDNGNLIYKGVSDSVMQLTFRFPKRDINLYLSSGDTLNVDYKNDIIRLSGDTVNSKVQEFYRKNVYYRVALKNMRDTLENYQLNSNYKNVSSEWQKKISEYISAYPNNYASGIILKENLPYYTDMTAISNLHKVMEDRYPVVSRQISNYVINGRVPAIKSKVSSFNLRNEYKRKEDEGDNKKKNFNIFDNNGNYNVITFWSYDDSLSVKRVKELNALSKKFKNKNLRFVTVSLDTDQEKWKKNVDRLNIPGRNFILEKGLGFDVIQRLGVNTIPYNIITNDKLIITDKNVFGKELETLLNSNVKEVASKKK